MKPVPVTLNKGMEDGRIMLEIRFCNNERIEHLIKSLYGIRWSETKDCWIIPWSVAHEEAIMVLLKPLAIITILESDPFLESLTTVSEPAQEAYHEVWPPNTGDLQPAVWQEIRRFIQWMQKHQYKHGTIETYTGSLLIFLRFFKDKPIEQIGNQDINRFITEYLEQRKCSPSYQNQTINALRLFFRITDRTVLDTRLLERKPRQRFYPHVLQEHEVNLIIAHASNLKHRAMLSLVYHCGMKTSELIALKPKHILADRGLVQLWGKDGRLREIQLNESLLSLLRTYYRTYRPSIYLFEGKYKGFVYDERSLQQALRQAVARSGITLPVTLHWLRHSYAVHLLEHGVDPGIIQHMLGHKTPKTIEVYQQLARKNTTSPVSQASFLQ